MVSAPESPPPDLRPAVAAPDAANDADEPARDDARAAGAGIIAMPQGFITTIQVEPVGRWFLAHWNRINSNRARTSTDGDASSSDSEEDASEIEVEFEDDLEFLRSLDPKECKDQDHYRVLGITTLRHKATGDQIRKAYRFKVLKHHPDKRRATGEEIRDDDDYFTCITKASEILGNAVKRLAYDSVDPLFDDDVPEPTDKATGKRLTAEHFFYKFRPAFERNARWSVSRRHVPKVGDADSSREDVEKFYNFWYAFDSWREFSYLDEEDKEKGSDRYERRWMEKENRVQRAERKKEEMKRIRRLVDNAYAADPRLLLFKEQDKAEKAARKKTRADAIQARKDEEERLREEAEAAARAQRERAEAEEKARLEAVKKEKDVQKKALKKERKTLRTLAKDADFFVADEGGEDERLEHMKELDRLCEILGAVELAALNDELRGSDADGDGTPVCGGGGGGGGGAPRRLAFRRTFQQLNERMEADKIAMIERTVGRGGGGGGGGSDKSDRDWTNDDLALLIKAVNLFPAGTHQRWEVAAHFIDQHTKTAETERSPHTAKGVLQKAKELQQGDFHLSSLKEEVNKKAYENLEKNKKRDVKTVDDSAASQRTESAAEAQGLNVSPWSPDEQKLLEQALKTYSANLGTERWEKIASCLPHRSKKDCMKRYKELAERIRAKKAAQAAAAQAAAATKKQ